MPSHSQPGATPTKSTRLKPLTNPVQRTDAVVQHGARKAARSGALHQGTSVHPTEEQLQTRPRPQDSNAKP